MRTAIILGRKHGGKSMELVRSPDGKIPKVLEAYKDFCRSEVHPELEYVELWTSDDGLTKRRKLISPERAKEIADAKAKAEAEAAAKADAEADGSEIPEAPDSKKKAAKAKAKADAEAEIK